MNKKQAYLDALNAGRRRRPSTAIEELNRTLAELEGQIAARSFEPHAPEVSDETIAAAADAIRQADRRHETVEEAGSIAAELKLLRDELNGQVAAGLQKEFAALRAEIETARANPKTACQAAELTEEVERLADMIQSLAARGDEDSARSLRAEMEEVRATLDQLAREETLRSVGQRWDEFDTRWSAFAERLEAGGGGLESEALDALHSRLEQIGAAVGTLPNTPSMRSLDEKLKILATAMDRFAEQKEPFGEDALELIEERLDEISRAIAASAGSARAGAVDTKPFERIEARIGSLAKQIDELLEDRPNEGVSRQIETLAARIDELAARPSMSDGAVTQLAEQVELIADKVQKSAATPQLGQIEERFAAISATLDERHENAMTLSRRLFAELEGRLDAFTSQFEQKIGDLPRVEIIQGFEERLDGISRRLETTTANLAAIDPDLVRSLEAQVASLSKSIAAPNEALERLEQTIADNHRSMLEVARKAAEDAVSGLTGPGAEADAVHGLAEDLRSLEALSRRSDDRNTKTFEAIHDTLLKIVDRLSALDDRTSSPEPAMLDPRIDVETTPPIEADLAELGFDEPDSDDPHLDDPETGEPARSAHQVAVEAAQAVLEDETGNRDQQRSMLGGIARALRGKKKPQTEDDVIAPSPLAASEPAIDFDAPLDPVAANQPLEPGSTPDLNAIMRRVRDERQSTRIGDKPDADVAKADFIAAARRAAQAAAAEAEMIRGTPNKGKSQRFKLGGLLRSRNKAVMMGIIAVTLALAGLQANKLFSGGQSVASDETAPAPVQAAAVAAPAVDAPAKPIRDLTAQAKAPAAAPLPLVETAAPRKPVAAAPKVETAPAASAIVFDPDTAFIPTVEDTEIEAASEATTIEAALPVAVPLEAGPAALREAAAAGDAKAFFEIGNRYAEGRGVEADMAKAAVWYEDAAEMGLVPAQYRIANLLEKGTGVERDIEKAKAWYLKAAASGNASAMHNLAVLNAMGAGGEVDNREAAKYFARAAELGVRDSQFNMGILAAKGVGMRQDLKQAYKWFALVAEAGDEDAKAKRDEVAGLLDEADLEEARQTADLWKAKTLDPEVNLVSIPNDWSESQETTASVDDLNRAVMQVQAILNANGYDAGRPDGIIGARTKSAIAAFQEANDMEPTGEVDEALVRALLALS